MTRKKPTIYDVAELAGVSIATVSRTMSGGIVSDASRKRVEEAMKALQYRPGASRVIGSNGTRAIALVVSNLTNPYYTSLLDGATEEARLSGYALQLYVHDLETPSDEAVVERVLLHKPDGVVLVGSMVENGEPERLAANVRRLLEEMPVVTMCPRVEGVQCINITSDPAQGMRKAIAHLVQLGHRRIAMIGGNMNIRYSVRRIATYLEEMERLGLTPPKPMDTGFTPQAGELGVSRLLATHTEKERPTAVIAINDMVALGVLRQLQRSGLRVPQDMALIGCDNLFFTPYLSPPLTTIDLHAFEHGQMAVSELIGAMRGGSAFHYSHTRESSLVVRESCGAGLTQSHGSIQTN